MFKRLRTQRGFMLMAIVMVLLAIGLLVLAIAAGAIIVATGNRFAREEDSLTRIQQALVQYAAVYRALPCPANPSLDATGSPVAGYANGNSTTPFPVATCLYPGGVVPWKTLGLSLSEVTDEWGRLISYRVYNGPYGLTQTGGASAVDCDTNNLSTPNVPPTATGLCDTRFAKHDTLRNNFITYSSVFSKGVGVDDFGQIVPNVAYVVFSHGPSGLGGYFPTGVRTPLPTAGALDYPNTQDTAGAFKRLAFSAAGTAPGDVGHYDDIVRYLTIADLLKLAGLEARDWPEEPPPSFTLATTSNMTLPSNDPLNPHFMSTGAAGSGQEFTQTTASGQVGITYGAGTGSYSSCLWWPFATTLVNDTQRFSLTAFLQFAATNNTGDVFPGFVMGFLSAADTVGASMNSFCGTTVSATTNATGAAGQNVISVDSTSGISQGMSAFGDGIPFNARVSVITPANPPLFPLATVTLTRNLTSAITSGSVSFSDSRSIRRDLGWAGGAMASYANRFGVEFDAFSDTGYGGPPVVATANDPSRPHLAVDYQGVTHGTDAATCDLNGVGLGCDAQSETPFPSVSTSAAGISGQSTINVSSVSGIVPGMPVSGSGIGGGATVTGLSGNVVTLSAPNASDVTGTITFDTLPTNNFMVNGLGVFNNLRVEIYPRDCVATTATDLDASTISVASANGIAQGMAVYGNGIGSGATVISVDGTTGTVMLSMPNSADVSGGIVFSNTFTQTLVKAWTLSNAGCNENSTLCTALKDIGGKFSFGLSEGASGIAGQTTLTVVSIAGIGAGMPVSGTGVGIGATVVSVDGTSKTVTLSAPNSADVSGPITVDGISTNRQVLYAVSCVPPPTSANSYDVLTFGITTATRTNAAAATTTATGTIGQSTITVSSNSGIGAGMSVRGTGIGNAATVVNVVGTTVTLSSANTAAVSGTVTFGGGANAVFQGISATTHLLP